jgi:glucose dehydrogenase
MTLEGVLICPRIDAISCGASQQLRFLAAGVAAFVSGRARTPNGKWRGYGNGADNLRYFASRQINKSNVTRLQVAWTYPYGDTSFGPIVVHGVIHGCGRNGSLVAVDAKTGKEIWTAKT